MTREDIKKPNPEALDKSSKLIIDLVKKAPSNEFFEEIEKTNEEIEKEIDSLFTEDCWDNFAKIEVDWAIDHAFRTGFKIGKNSLIENANKDFDAWYTKNAKHAYSKIPPQDIKQTWQAARLSSEKEIKEIIDANQGLAIELDKADTIIKELKKDLEWSLNRMCRCDGIAPLVEGAVKEIKLKHGIE